MTNSELMTIGRFARISGLSVHAPRHCDDVGILTPAEVDADAAHEKALAAGATEVVKPQDLQGMPRNSAVKDPSGNWVWIYQG